MTGPNVGYGTLTILPSMRGFDARMNQQLAPISTAAGRRMGDQMGNSFGSAWQRAASTAVQTTAATATTAFTAAAATGTAALIKGWNRLTTIQDASSALTISLDSTTAAAELLDDTLSVVQGTPFNLDQFASAGQRLVNFNVEAEKVPGYMEAIGEASATQGRRANEAADRLFTVFGQIAASGQVQLQDVWRISDAGVSALAILSNHFGLTRDEMKDMISDGAVPAGEALDALAAGILNGSDGPAGATRALAGSMEALRNNMSGAVAGVEPALARLGAAVIEPFSPAVVAGANGLVDTLDLLTDRAGDLAETVAGSKGYDQFLTFLETAPDKAEDLFGKLAGYGPGLATTGTALAAMGTRHLPLLNRFLPGVSGGVLGLGAGLGALALTSPEARQALLDLADDTLPVAAGFAEELLPVIEDVTDIAGDVLPGAIRAGSTALVALFEAGTPVVSMVGDLTGFLADHEEITWGVVGAYAAWKGAMITQAGWTAFAGGVTAATGAVRGMQGAIAGIAATRGVSNTAATLGVLRATLTMPVSGAAAAGGGLAGIAVGASLAFQSLRRSADHGREAADQFIETLDVDPNDTMGMQQGIVAINDRMKELSEEAGRSSWDQFKQRINPFDENTIDEAEAEADRLAGIVEDWSESVIRNARLASSLDMPTDELDRWIEKLELDPDTQPLRTVRTAIEDAATAARVGTSQTDGLAGAYADLADDTATATEKLDGYKTVLEELMGVPLSIFEAETGVADGLAGLTESITENGLTLDANTEAGRRNREALAGVASDVITLAEAYGEGEGGIAAANLKLEEGRQKLLEAGLAAGFSEDQMVDYLAQLGLTPDNVATLIELQGTEGARNELSDLQTMLDGLDGRHVQAVVTIMSQLAEGVRPTESGLINLPPGYDPALGNDRWGGMYEFARGGFTEAEMLGAGRALYRWREPETGGELLVPRFGDRNRSEALMRRASSDWFGGRFVSRDEMTRWRSVMDEPSPIAGIRSREGSARARAGRRRTRDRGGDVHVHTRGPSARQVADEIQFEGV